MKKAKQWLLILIVTPLAAIAGWCGFLLFLYYVIGPIQGLSHAKDQKFATEGTPKIEIAKQIEEIFGPSRRYISYGISFDEQEWNSEVLLYGRYQLWMQVPVKITSANSGTTTGHPTFQLSEIKINTNTGIVSFSGGKGFYENDWKKLYKAKGDFKVIGLELKTNAPIKNIEAYYNVWR